MSTQFVINPDTKKKIKVGGPKYQELIAAGKIVPAGARGATKPTAKRSGEKKVVPAKKTAEKPIVAKRFGEKKLVAKNLPVATITPFNTDDITYVVFSSPNLAITVKQAQTLQKIDTDAAIDLAFFNELYMDADRPEEYSVYKKGVLTTTIPGRDAVARKYEKIVEAAQGVDQPQIGALGFRVSAEYSDQIAKQVSEILGLKQLYFPIVGEGTAEYNGLTILYRVYQKIPQTYHTQQLKMANDEQKRKDDLKEANRLKSEQMALEDQLGDLQDAHEVWKAAKDKKKAKDMIERSFNARWPDYNYKGVSIFDQLQDFQNDAADEGIDTYYMIPLYYDLQDDELIFGIRDDWDEGGEEEEYKEIQKYEDGDRVLVLFAK